MIRADFTVDGFRSNFDGTTSSCGALRLADPAFAGTGCRSEDESTAAALSFMVNGYVDLGTYVGFTPYVGGGLGYTYVDWGPLSDSVFCVRPVPVRRGHCSPTTEHDGDQSWRFTYASMAGLAYDVSTNLKVDLGYRYRRIEGGPMFAFDPAIDCGGRLRHPGRRPWLLVARGQGRPALRALVGTRFQMT